MKSKMSKTLTSTAAERREVNVVVIWVRNSCSMPESVGRVELFIIHGPHIQRLRKNCGTAVQVRRNDTMDVF